VNLRNKPAFTNFYYLIMDFQKNFYILRRFVRVDEATFSKVFNLKLKEDSL